MHSRIAPLSVLSALLLAACAQPPAPTAKPTAATAKPTLALRAVGTEPGWAAEVHSGEPARISLQLDYGERKLQVARASATPDGYTGLADDGSAVNLSYRRETCSDGMSDRDYPASVSLQVGDKQYKGCAELPTP
ncbi:hypothetical protein [Pseudomonas sp. CGJS7]|uniref:hypothetical protein n=1 Tax=Pseudomonas sp. CGJS7 TaxID=3109348 RepID=UPI0030089B95